MTVQIPVFYVGGLARMSPASDWWMRGVKTARVMKLGRKWIHLQAETPGLVAAKFKISRKAANAHVESVL